MYIYICVCVFQINYIHTYMFTYIIYIYIIKRKSVRKLPNYTNMFVSTMFPTKVAKAAGRWKQYSQQQSETVLCMSTVLKEHVGRR